MNTEARVDSYTAPLDAELAKAYLQSHDIPVRLEGDVLGGAAFAIGPVLGGIQLYVDEQDGERATQLLSDYHDQLSAEHLAKRETPEHLVTRACMAAFIGYITIPLFVHAYSVWMLLKVDRKTLAPEKRYLYPLAWVGNAIAFGAFLVWVALLLAR